MRECTQCGKCCLKYGGSGLGGATDEDLAMWEETRPDIMQYIDEVCPDLWVSPVTGEEMFRCPFLRKRPKQDKYNCRIHDVRPWVCRDYPVSIQQMLDDECEMLEKTDRWKSHRELMKELTILRNKKGKSCKSNAS